MGSLFAPVGMDVIRKGNKIFRKRAFSVELKESFFPSAIAPCHPRPQFLLKISAFDLE